MSGLTLLTIAIIWSATLFTSAMSSIFGMTGGMILMGALLTVLPLSATMILHGMIQLTANSYRAWLNRHDIRWRLIAGYMVGTVFALLIFSLAVTYFALPNPAVVFLTLGALPFIAYALPPALRLDITRPFIAPLSGLLIGVTNLLAGVAGPLLDVFFQRSNLTRHEVVASKAMTQVIAHSIKILFYGWLAHQLSPPLSAGSLPINEAIWPPLWLFAGCFVLSVVGTTLGKRLLDRMTDKNFFRWTQRILFTVGLVFLIRGWLVF